MTNLTILCFNVDIKWVKWLVIGHKTDLLVNLSAISLLHTLILILNE